MYVELRAEAALSVTFACEPWSCRNIVCFKVLACTAAPGSAVLVGSLSNV